MAKEEWDHVGNVYRRKPKKDGNAAAWIIGIIAFLLILAAI
ncbi:MULTISPECIES: hypothetical protein [Hyphomonas]